MLPLALDVAAWPILLAGGGEALRKRLALLDEAGAGALTVHAPDASADIRASARDRLVESWPTAAQIAATRVLFVAGLPLEQAAPMGQIARANRVLLNIEDERDWCDFHVPAIVRRGDLLLSVSTGGGSPAMAGYVRERLEVAFGPEWAGHLDAAAAYRTTLRAQGASYGDVLEATRMFIRQRVAPPGG